MGGFASARWAVLVDLWEASNLALAAVIERIPEERLTADCQIGEAPLVTLKFLIDDYILHMQHHLAHILGIGGGGTPTAKVRRRLNSLQHSNRNMFFVARHAVSLETEDLEGETRSWKKTGEKVPWSSSPRSGGRRR
jgi:hypothetical protein